jgi:2-amino-4-hydroxy-6-hydroxymethyldihydropteridine diphosphokinase
MILIALGGNLASAVGPPPATFVSALTALDKAGVRVVRRSALYVSPPWPQGSDPDFYNQAVMVETRRPPGELLQLLLKIETAHGRVRREAWGPRTLDLDIVDYQGLVTDVEHVALPHPWTEERAFVLKPVAEIAPDWRHPISGLRAEEALAALDPAEAGACNPFVPA